MNRGDIRQVTEIDREAFPTLWPPANYRRELENRFAHYIVACDDERLAPPAEAPRPGGIASLVDRLRHRPAEAPPPPEPYIHGFAGFWIMAGEIHITNIAVRVKSRRQGIGELLLISLLELAGKHRTSFITLEVRESNTAAQSLYAKYGFIRTGRRRGYYTDNGEDAALMSLQDINAPATRANLERLRQGYLQKRAMAVYRADDTKVRNKV